MHFAQTEINMKSFLFTDETKIRSSSKTLKKNDKKINLSFCKTILDSCGLLDEPIKSLNSKYQYGINIITNTFIHTLTSTHTLLVTVYRSIGVQESSVRYLKTINATYERMRHTKETRGNDTNTLKSYPTRLQLLISDTQVTQVIIAILRFVSVPASPRQHRIALKSGRD